MMATTTLKFTEVCWYIVNTQLVSYIYLYMTKNCYYNIQYRDAQNDGNYYTYKHIGTIGK